MLALTLTVKASGVKQQPTPEGEIVSHEPPLPVATVGVKRMLVPVPATVEYLGQRIGTAKRHGERDGIDLAEDVIPDRHSHWHSHTAAGCLEAYLSYEGSWYLPLIR